MLIISDQVLISLVVTGGAILQAIVNGIITRAQSRKTREKVDLIHNRISAIHDEDKIDREKLATLTLETKEELASKLEDNTNITKRVASDTSLIFNGTIDKLQEVVKQEFSRQSENMHSLRNAITMIVGDVKWKDRKEEKKEEKKQDDK